MPMPYPTKKIIDSIPEWKPDGNWRKTFILLPRIIDEQTVFLRFVYRRRYNKFGRIKSETMYKYHLSELEILRDETA